LLQWETYFYLSPGADTSSYATVSIHPSIHPIIYIQSTIYLVILTHSFNHPPIGPVCQSFHFVLWCA